MTSFGRSGAALVLMAGLWSGCSSAPPELPGYEPSTGGTGASGGTTGGTVTTGGAGGTTGGTTGASGGKGGTTSGSSGTGVVVTASGGTMAATVCGSAVGAATDKLVDDLEDGDNTIGNGVGQPDPPTRVGYWFTYNETTDGSASCKQTPAPDPSGLLPFPPQPNPGNGSSFGAHTNGTGCSAIWGAGLGVDFNNCSEKSNAYDGSAYTGVSFWYKSTTPLRVTVATLPNLPTAEGGMCSADCYNHHGKNFAAAPSGTTATITWAELRGTAQIGTPPMNPQTYGQMRTFNPAQLLAMQFQVDQAGGGSFDFWVDDVSFE
jgi:hypothetical protein